MVPKLIDHLAHEHPVSHAKQIRDVFRDHRLGTRFRSHANEMEEQAAVLAAQSGSQTGDTYILAWPTARDDIGFLRMEGSYIGVDRKVGKPVF